MKLRDAFLMQARSCAGLGSRFMERLLSQLAEHWPLDSDLGQVCANWPENDLGPSGASMPLRIAGGLHALVLTNRDAGLSAVYPPNETSDQQLIDAVLQSLSTHKAFLLNWIQSPPQTNEVRRSAALIPVAHWIARHDPLPFVTSELGASAGLNLMWDLFSIEADDHRLGPDRPVLVLNPEWTGPVPPTAQISVTDRRGVDLNPLNARDPDDALRLFAYLWPDQPHRMELTRAAISAQNATIDQGDAIDWLETRLEMVPAGHLHLIYHTIAWQYFPADRQLRGKALIEAAGARATATKPLAWLRMEADEAGKGAGLSLRLWPGDLKIDLARVDFHGRWIDWRVI